jgi:predicted membrane protein
MVSRAWDGPGRAAPRAPGDRAELAFWSGIERRITSQDFRRADVTAIMGGIELDLRGAAMAGSEATIEVFAVMGGIEITLPPDWEVVNRITPILGGVEDQSTGAASSQHRLILEGMVIMGGVEVKT